MKISSRVTLGFVWLCQRRVNDATMRNSDLILVKVMKEEQEKLK